MGGGSEVGEKWGDVELVLAWPVNGWIVEGEAKGVIMDDSAVFELSRWMDDDAIHQNRVDWGLECGTGFLGEGDRWHKRVKRGLVVAVANGEEVCSS